MKETNWVPFHFESNQSWGWCNTPEEWAKVKANYCAYHETIDLSKARQNSHPDFRTEELRLDFGFRREHTGEYTLADFAKDNNMIL